MDAGLGHARVGFGAAFDDAGFVAVGAVGQDDQFRQRCAGLGGAEPAEGVEEADLIDEHFLAAGRFDHHQSHQVIDEREHRQFFEHAFDRVAAQDFHFHRRFEVAQIGFDAPPSAVQFGEGFRRIALGIEQRGHDRDGRSPATGLLDFDAEFADAERGGQGVVVVLVHPVGLLSGLDVVDELVVLAQAFPPSRGRESLRSVRRRFVVATGAEVDDLALVAAEDGVEISLGKQGQMRKRREAAVGDEEVARLEFGRHGVGVGHVVGP